MLFFSSAIYSENTLDYYDIAWVVQEVFHGRCVYTNKGITGNKLVFFLPLVPSRRNCVAGIPPSLLLLTMWFSAWNHMLINTNSTSLWRRWILRLYVLSSGLWFFRENMLKSFWSVLLNKQDIVVRFEFFSFLSNFVLFSNTTLFNKWHQKLHIQIRHHCFFDFNRPLSHLEF